MILEKLIQEVKEIVSNKLSDFYEGFTLIHTEILLEICMALSKSFDVRGDIIKVSVLLHDVGRTVSDDSSHPNESWKIAENILKGKISEEELELVKDCILNHSSNGNPISTEAKLIKDCDKISMVDPKVLLNFFYNISKKSENKDEAIKHLLNMIGKSQNNFIFEESRKYYEENYKPFVDFILGGLK